MPDPGPTPALHEANDTSGDLPVVLQVSPAYSQAMDPEELSHLNEMLDHIQSLSISNSQTSVYDKIGLKADDREIYVPPTTHLVATVDDLTDVLDYDEATDMDEDVDSPTETTMPLVNTGRWSATSTYDVYIVDTPKPPSRHR